ncbi:MAG: hypothetical protein ACTSV7_10560, partial [Candidatus Baldrarchaeia archaeon]
MKRVILNSMIIFFVLVSIGSAQSITIDSVNPSSLTTLKNREFTVAVTYTIIGTFDSCYLKVDETTLPAGWQVVETNPKQINCSSGTSYIPKIVASVTGDAEVRIIIEGKGASPQQATSSFYATIKEGAILDASLISNSSITVKKGERYTIEFNIKNSGDTDTENAIATITCPSGYDCPSSIVLKEAGQANGVITPGQVVYAAFTITAINPSSGYLNITISATNSLTIPTLATYLSYTPPEEEHATPTKSAASTGGAIGAPLPIEAVIPVRVNATTGRASITISTINKGETINITIEKVENLSIRGIEITAGNSVGNVKITIETLTQRPSDVTRPTGETYQYFKVEKKNIHNENIS